MDNENENGNYHSRIGSYMGYIGVLMEKTMETSNYKGFRLTAALGITCFRVCVASEFIGVLGVTFGA